MWQGSSAFHGLLGGEIGGGVGASPAVMRNAAYGFMHYQNFLALAEHERKPHKQTETLHGAAAETVPIEAVIDLASDHYAAVVLESHQDFSKKLASR